MNLRALLNWYLSPKFDAYHMSDFDVANVARLIQGEYLRREFSLSLVPCKIETISIPTIQHDVYLSRKTLAPIVEIRNELKAESPESITHFILHGSLADMKFVPGWSDVDTWVVIKDKVFEDLSAMLKLRVQFSKLNKYLLEVDPIAHHGFIIVLESDLASYDESIMPVAVLQQGKCIYGEDKVRICVRPTKSGNTEKLEILHALFYDLERSGTFNSHPYRGAYLTNEMLWSGDGMYQLKYIISALLSVPSLYFTAKGTPRYKADTFEPFIKRFADQAGIIESFSTIRTRWGTEECSPFIPNRIPKWLLDMIPKDYCSQILLLLEKVSGDISDDNNK